MVKSRRSASSSAVPNSWTIGITASGFHLSTKGSQRISQKSKPLIATKFSQYLIGYWEILDKLKCTLHRVMNKWLAPWLEFGYFEHKSLHAGLQSPARHPSHASLLSQDVWTALGCYTQNGWLEFWCTQIAKLHWTSYPLKLLPHCRHQEPTIMAHNIQSHSELLQSYQTKGGASLNDVPTSLELCYLTSSYTISLHYNWTIK